jgi:hypothetical protein
VYSGKTYDRAYDKAYDGVYYMAKPTTIRMADHVLEAIERFAEQSDTTTTQVILWAIEDFVPGIVEPTKAGKQPRRKPREKRSPKMEELPLAKGAYGGPSTGRIVKDEYSQADSDY